MEHFHSQLADLWQFLAGFYHGDRLSAGGSDGPENPLRERLPHHHALPLCPLVHCDGPGLAMDHEPHARPAGHHAQSGVGKFPVRLDRAIRHGDLCAPDRRSVAGNRVCHDPDARRSARHRRRNLEGVARRRHSDLENLPLRCLADDARRYGHGGRDYRIGYRAPL